jgi:ankyrin repeat protein
MLKLKYCAQILPLSLLFICSTLPLLAAPIDHALDAPLTAAVEKNDTAAVKELLAKHANPNLHAKGAAVLDRAIINENVEMVRLLTDAGARVNDYDPQWHDDPLVTAATSENADVVKVLIDHGAEVNHKGSNDWTALCWATINNHLDIMRVLLSNKADINTRDNTERTPLMLAVQRGKLEAMKLLLERHAEINLKDKDGKTALTYAKEETKDDKGTGTPELVRVLLAAGAR